MKLKQIRLIIISFMVILFAMSSCGNSSVEKLKSKLIDTNNRLSLAEQKITVLEQRIDKLENIERLSAMISDNSDNTETFENLSDGLIANKKVIARHEEVIAEHEEVIAEHEEVIARHEEVIAGHEEVIAGHEEVIAGHEEVIAGQEKILLLVIDYIESDIEKLRIEITNMNTLKNTLSLSMKSLQLQFIELDNFLQKLVNTKTAIEQAIEIGFSEIVLYLPRIISVLEEVKETSEAISIFGVTDGFINEIELLINLLEKTDDNLNSYQNNMMEYSEKLFQDIIELSKNTTNILSSVNKLTEDETYITFLDVKIKELNENLKQKEIMLNNMKKYGY